MLSSLAFFNAPSLSFLQPLLIAPFASLSWPYVVPTSLPVTYSSIDFLVLQRETGCWLTLCACVTTDLDSAHSLVPACTVCYSFIYSPNVSITTHLS